MLQDIVIIHNIHCEKSRKLVADNPQYQVIDFYGKTTEKEKTFIVDHPEIDYVSAFPAVLHYPKLVLLNDVSNMQAALNEFDNWTLVGGVPVRKGSENDVQFQAEQQLKAFKKCQSDRIEEVRWAIDRHRDEKDQGVLTTLTDAQFKQLLVYVQAIRDAQKDYTSADMGLWPIKPYFV